MDCHPFTEDQDHAILYNCGARGLRIHHSKLQAFQKRLFPYHTTEQISRRAKLLTKLLKNHCSISDLRNADKLNTVLDKETILEYADVLISF